MSYFTCRCGRLLRTTVDAALQKVRCTGCGHIQTVVTSGVGPSKADRILVVGCCVSQQTSPLPH
jgi:hypothetical protein